MCGTFVSLALVRRHVPRAGVGGKALKDRERSASGGIPLRDS